METWIEYQIDNNSSYWSREEVVQYYQLPDSMADRLYELSKKDSASGYFPFFDQMAEHMIEEHAQAVLRNQERDRNIARLLPFFKTQLGLYGQPEDLIPSVTLYKSEPSQLGSEPVRVLALVG